MAAKKGGKKNPKKGSKTKTKGVKDKKNNKKRPPKKHGGFLTYDAIQQRKKTEIAQKKHKLKCQPKIKEEEEHEEDVEELPLEEADLKFFGNSKNKVRHPGMADWILGDKNKKDKNKAKKRKLTPDQNDEKSYEKIPRTAFNTKEKKVKHLLPIKTAQGIVPQVQEIDDDVQVSADETEDQDIYDDSDEGELNGSDDEEYMIEEEGKDDEPEDLPTLTVAQLYALRQKKLNEKKQRIALLASAITEDPEKNIRRLKELRNMLEEKEPDIVITVRKFIMLTLSEIFKDIIPGYKIRPKTDDEDLRSMKKETKTLRDYEMSLLNNYRLYLQFLETTITGVSPGPDHENEKIFAIPIPDEAKQGLMELAVKCLCYLLTQQTHFNFNSNIIATIIPLLNHKNQKVSDTVSDACKEIFKEDKLGQISLEITRAITKLIKSKSYSVKTKVLQVFLSLKIKKVDFSGEEVREKKMTHKQKLKKLSRTERKKLKANAELDRELENAAVQERTDQKTRLHTQIVESVFLTYFRILKKAPQSILLSTVLEGLAKFAHLINLDFFNDLFTVLNNLIQSGNLTSIQTCHCIQTAFTILTGQGSALNIDPLHFYTHLYSILPTVTSASSDDIIPVILDCLDLMFVRRKKQVTHQRVLGYIKRLSCMVLQLDPHSAVGLLASIRSILHAHKRSDILYDTEHHGSGLYMPELKEPEHCNAQNTALFELHLIKYYYHPIVQLYTKHLIKQAPASGEGQLPQQLVRSSPIDVFESYNPSNVDNMFVSQKVNRKSSSKKKWHQYLQPDMKSTVNKISLKNSEEDLNLDFLSELNRKK